jgi:hypothetical protein
MLLQQRVLIFPDFLYEVFTRILLRHRTHFTDFYEIQC